MLDLAIDGRVFITNQLDAALQELDMIFNTEYTELIGYPTYGTNFESFLWSLSPSVSVLKQYIEDKMNDSYFLKNCSKQINVAVLKGKYRAIYHIEITIFTSDGKSGKRTYELR